jgi:hypothetical protein
MTARMDNRLPLATVQFPDASPQAKERLLANRQRWPEDARDLAEALQQCLAIGDRDWHALKSHRPRRAAEQIAAALVQLIAADQPAQAASTPAREQAVVLLEHALGWLRAEHSDPGCPAHGR